MKTIDKVLLMAGAAAAMMDGSMPSVTPEPRRDSSKPATLTPKEWRKRKSRLRMQKKSRHINRAS
jgi:hypothetical protein